MVTSTNIKKPLERSKLIKEGFILLGCLGDVFKQIKRLKGSDLLLYHRKKGTPYYVVSIANKSQVMFWVYLYIEQNNLKSPAHVTLKNFTNTIRAVDTDDYIFINKYHV